jgi:WYL domain
MLDNESSSGEGPPLRWSVERRLAFIEERLFWLGAVNRHDVVRRFGVSMSQASGDIARYLALEPPGLAYDKSAKRYVANEDFRPALAPPDAGRFLGELRLVQARLIAGDETTLGTVPPFDAGPMPERAVDALVVRAVFRAVMGQRVLAIIYQSMSRPEPLTRIIEPHAFVYDGFRWHARAFDRQREDFLDFVLGRMSDPRDAGPAIAEPAADTDWSTFVELLIAPHPGLTPSQAQAIRLDYGMGETPTIIRVRRAYLFYALKRLGLDVPPETRKPWEQHIVLINRDEIEALRNEQDEA